MNLRIEIFLFDKKIINIKYALKLINTLIDPNIVLKKKDDIRWNEYSEISIWWEIIIINLL